MKNVLIIVLATLLVIGGAAAIYLVSTNEETPVTTDETETATTVDSSVTEETATESDTTTTTATTVDEEESTVQESDEGISNEGVSGVVYTTFWDLHTNEANRFSVLYPTGWEATDSPSEETHFNGEDQSFKYIVVSYVNAPQTDEEREDPTYLQSELDDIRAQIDQSASTKTISGYRVRFTNFRDQESASIVRRADFFDGEDYVRFSTVVLGMTICDTEHPCSGEYDIDFRDEEAINDLLESLDRNETSQEIQLRIDLFDTMIGSITQL
ncbi:MAG: hypothetical protein ABIG66_05585 [Candidatus Kerfeldbacteria bacterium]